MRRYTTTVILLISASLRIISVQSQLFQVVPTNECVPCGGSTVFNCSTLALHPLVGGGNVEGVGGQLWKINNTNGTQTLLRSNMPNNLPADYEFISPSFDEYTGIRVTNISSSWNGTTFQCIAFTPANIEQRNTSAATVTLEVGGLPHPVNCSCSCLPGTMEQCNIHWECPCTVSCSSLQFNVSLTEPDGTLAYSESFGQDITSTQTTPLNKNTEYSVTIIAENRCGKTNCSASCSSATPSPSPSPTQTLPPLQYLPPTLTPSPTSSSAGPVTGEVVGGSIILIAVLATF